MLRYRKMMDSEFFGDSGASDTSNDICESLSGDRSASFEVKQVHLQNLHRMVHYCENVTDCRRAQQLEYFAEHFTREQCMENQATACDNCLKQGEYKVSNNWSKLFRLKFLTKVIVCCR